jgi:hypothetical protein
MEEEEEEEEEDEEEDEEEEEEDLFVSNDTKEGPWAPENSQNNT